MDDLIEEVNRALRARGWSARHASRQVGGSLELIRNLSRGHFSALERFRSLCEVLGLGFYVGPPRELGAVDERRLEEALATVERVLTDSDDFVLAPDDKARVVAAVYGMLGESRSPATTARIKRLVSAMAAGRRVPRREGER